MRVLRSWDLFRDVYRDELAVAALCIAVVAYLLDRLGKRLMP